MATREIGQYRDASLETEEIVRKAPHVLETFVQERIKNDPPFFKQIGPDMRHILSGVTIEEYFAPAELRKRSPHGFADWMPDTQEQLEFDVIEDACLRPQPKTVGKLFTLLGDMRAKSILAEWGTDWTRMIPGTRPGGPAPEVLRKAAETVKADAAEARNPFNPKYKTENREAEIAQFIRAFGSKASVQSAQRFSVDLAGRPLAKRA
jgi:hypothetical protein